MLLQRMIHAAFGQGAIRVLVNANTTDMNLFIAAGSPAKAVRVVMTIAAGVIVGATTAVSYALNVGQFPAGSDITIDNYGQILGAGGAGNGGTGGSAINADYPNQTVVIRNHPGANIYAGGGGGGRGGTGGKGGTGGQGYYQAWSSEAYDGYSYLWRTDTGPEQQGGAWWGGSIVGTNAQINAAGTQYGNYLRGSQRTTTTYTYDVGEGTGTAFVRWYGIHQLQNVFTNGGVGGNGGAGGVGGQGQGYDRQAGPIAGAAGTGGSSGAAGGTNAGQGGTGGTGGTGGAGGGWGASGINGSTGNTGGAGFSGNYTGGGSGTAGAAGSTGGLAGFYLKKGTASVTLINNGAVAGRLG